MTAPRGSIRGRDSVPQFSELLVHLRVDLWMEVHSLVYEIVQDVDIFGRGHGPVFGTLKQQCRHSPALDALSPGDL